MTPEQPSRSDPVKCQVRGVVGGVPDPFGGERCPGFAAGGRLRKNSGGDGRDPFGGPAQGSPATGWGDSAHHCERHSGASKPSIT